MAASDKFQIRVGGSLSSVSFAFYVSSTLSSYVMKLNILCVYSALSLAVSQAVEGMARPLRYVVLRLSPSRTLLAGTIDALLLSLHSPIHHSRIHSPRLVSLPLLGRHMSRRQPSSLIAAFASCRAQWTQSWRRRRSSRHSSPSYPETWYGLPYQMFKFL